MKQMLILCVTYNSYQELYAYLQTIDEAAAHVSNDWQVDVYIGDNTEKDLQQITFKAERIRRIKKFLFPKNLGYLGAAQRMMSECPEITNYDYVAISNVDLEMPVDFFDKLSRYTLDDNVGWVANAILSSLEKRDRNPGIVCRYSEKRLKQLKLLFKYPILHYLYTKTLYLRKKFIKHHTVKDIYAGHGSFILLTQAFIKKYPLLNYPVFLFCEEIYLGELCLKAGLKVKYEPSIIINDSEHCSTGKMKRRFYYRCNYDAISYILKTFY